MALFLLLLLFENVNGIELQHKTNGVREARDSYLDAYKETHDENVSANIRRKSQHQHQTGVEDYPSDQFGSELPYKYNGMSQSSYRHPNSDYPNPSYGVPSHAHHHHHHHPAHHYGPPADSSYGIPYSLLGIFDKFKLKLNLITIFKILLKIVLFKKFVSFVAIICFLLFIPWLKAKKAIHHHHGGGGGGGGNYDDDDDEEDDLMRKMPNLAHFGNNRINSTTIRVLQSIEKFEKENSTNFVKKD